MNEPRSLKGPFSTGQTMASGFPCPEDVFDGAGMQVCQCDCADTATELARTLNAADASAAHIAELQAKVATLQRERDAAVKDVRTLLEYACHGECCIEGYDYHDSPCQCEFGQRVGPIRKRYPDAGRSGEADQCEHGVLTGDWCEPCNKAYKDARDEFGYSDHPIQQSLDAIHAAGGSAWDKVDDPQAAIDEMRGE